MDQRPYRWHYIDSVYLCEKENAIVQLGTLNDTLTNFARIEFGEGYFYLHTTPLTLTNYHLLEEEGVAYAERLFSHLPKGDIYWDAFSRVSEAVGLRQNEAQGGDGEIPNETPLKYVLSQPSLAWAWYLSLVLGLLYLVFRAKRKQRMISYLRRE